LPGGISLSFLTGRLSGVVPRRKCTGMNGARWGTHAPGCVCAARSAPMRFTRTGYATAHGLCSPGRWRARGCLSARTVLDRREESGIKWTREIRQPRRNRDDDWYARRVVIHRSRVLRGIYYSVSNRTFYILLAETRILDFGRRLRQLENWFCIMLILSLCFIFCFNFSKVCYISIIIIIIIIRNY